MNVVIVGARFRNEQSDIKLVNDLIDGLKAMYPNLFIITTGVDRGIGKLIKNRLMPPTPSEEPEVHFLDITYRIFAKDRPKAFYAKLYLSRNKALVDAGEEFHVLTDGEKVGHTQDLIELVTEAGLPLSIYWPNEQTGPKLLR